MANNEFFECIHCGIPLDVGQTECQSVRACNARRQSIRRAQELIKPIIVRMELEAECDEDRCPFSEPMSDCNADAVVQMAMEHTRTTGHKVYFRGSVEVKG